MEKRRKKTLSRKRHGSGALVNKRGADLRTKSLDLTIRQLRAAGYTTVRAISAELTRRKVPTARGGNWHPTTVQRLLARLGCHGSGALVNKRGADLRAKSLDLTIRQLRAAGYTMVRAISAELTRQKVPTARGGNWHLTTVQRLLARLG